MAKKNRQIVNDISKTSLTAPGGASAANLPSLRTTVPNTATNQMLKSFAGFNSAIQQIGIAREKNAAAAEAVAAKNAALTGEFQVFDRADSVNLYHQQLGDIKGKSDSLLFGQDLDDLSVSILNSGVDAATAMQMYTDGYGKLSKQRFGKEGNGAFEHESEYYKSGYIPHQIDAIEKRRVKLAADHKAKFIAQSKEALTESAKNKLNEYQLTQKFNADNPDSSGIVVAQPTFSIDDFVALEKEGANLLLEKQEVREQLVQTFAQEAVERKDESILEFFKQRLPDGTLVENNLKLNKIIDTAYVSAASARIAEDKEERRKQKLILETNQRVSRRNIYQFAANNPDSPIEAKEAAQSAADLYDWTPEQLAKSLTFVDAISGDRAITWNPAEEDVVMRGILAGNLTSPEELQDIYVQSRYDGTGINKDSLARLQKTLDDVNANGNKASAFQRNKDALLREFGLSNDSVLVVSDDGSEEFKQKRAIIAEIINNYDLGLSAWNNKNAQEGVSTESLWSQEANKFFDELRETVKHAALEKIDNIGEEDNPVPNLNLTEPTLGFGGNQNIEGDKQKLKAFREEQYHGRILNKKIDKAKKRMEIIRKLALGEY